VSFKHSIVACLGLCFAQAASAAAPAIVRGTLSLAQGAPAVGVDLRLVDVASGRVTVTRSDAAGVFRAPVAPGIYGLEAGGFSLEKGPQVLTAAAGREAVASLVLAPIGPASSALTIEHRPVGCLVANEHAEIDAVIRPATKVKRARVFFKAARDRAYHYVEMAPEIGRFVACLPQSYKDASPVEYYIEAETADAESTRTGDFDALVVNKADECPQPRLTAVICPCRVPVAVYDMAGQPVFPSAFGGIAGQLGGALVSPIAGTASLVAIGASAIGVTVIAQPGPASPSR
jgi:hypothetical protein